MLLSAPPLASTTSSLATVMLTLVHAARRTRLADDNLRHLWECWPETVPDPLGENFAGWILEPFHIVQVVMVEASQQWFDRARQVGEVADPAGFMSDRRLQVHGESVGVPV